MIFLVLFFVCIFYSSSFTSLFDLNETLFKVCHKVDSAEVSFFNGNGYSITFPSFQIQSGGTLYLDNVCLLNFSSNIFDQNENAFGKVILGKNVFCNFEEDLNPLVFNYPLEIEGDVFWNLNGRHLILDPNTILKLTSGSLTFFNGSLEIRSWKCFDFSNSDKLSSIKLDCINLILSEDLLLDYGCLEIVGQTSIKSFCKKALVINVNDGLKIFDHLKLKDNVSLVFEVDQNSSLLTYFLAEISLYKSSITTSQPLTYEGRIIVRCKGSLTGNIHDLSSSNIFIEKDSSFLVNQSLVKV